MPDSFTSTEVNLSAALIEAARQRSNIDLRVCATHSLGRIGAESAVRFLAKRSTDPSVNQGDRSAAISALGEIGSPSALPACKRLRRPARIRCCAL